MTKTRIGPGRRRRGRAIGAGAAAAAFVASLLVTSGSASAATEATKVSATSASDAGGGPYTQAQLRERSRQRAQKNKQFLDTRADGDLEATVAADVRAEAKRQARAANKADGRAPAAAAASTLPTGPLAGDIDGCLGSDEAEAELGRVYNRFVYCRSEAKLPMDFIVEYDGEPILLGRSTLTYDVVGYGDKGARTTRIFVRVTGEDFEINPAAQLIPQLQPAINRIDDSTVDIGAGCYNGQVVDTTCTPSELGDTSRTLRQWGDAADDWLIFDLRSNKPPANTPGVGTELVWRHEWRVTAGGWPGDFYQPMQPAFSPSRTIRCDSATYIRGQGDACVFDDVIPRLVYSTKSTRHAGIAAHIKQALDDPDSTYPLKPNGQKQIPGKYTGDDSDNGLHRLKPGDPQLTENTDHKNAACYDRGPVRAEYTGLGLPLALRPRTTATGAEKEDCDEYPFRAVREGAASPIWDFSVKAVNASQNRSAGASLGAYFNSDRILRADLDEFWVDITDEPFENEPDPSDSGLDAGPDVNGQENVPIFLNGRADTGDDEEVYWTYAIVDADEGTTCTFENARDPQTFFRCTDDGTFTVTLNLDNGIEDELQTDSATVTFVNLPPVITSVEPPEWSLYRVGTPVDFKVNFTDSPNDTHQCTIAWDDASVPLRFPAQDHVCGRPHTFQQAGMYTISGTVVDDDGGEASFSRMIVVYDPKAGWANVDGGATVPDGSYQNPSSGPTGGTNKFHARAEYYAPADTRPKGRAGTSLEGTGLQFESAGDTQVDWLVVTPDNKVAMRGQGTLKDGSTRAFLVYGWDAARDRSRVVLWDPTTTVDPPTGAQQTAMLDTARGSSSYDVDRSGSNDLTSGSVQIHRP